MFAFRGLHTLGVPFEPSTLYRCADFLSVSIAQTIHPFDVIGERMQISAMRFQHAPQRVHGGDDLAIAAGG